MANVWTTVRVNGKTIDLEADWVGEKDAPYSVGQYHDSSKHNVLTISTDEGEEDFDCWGSVVEPVIETKEQLISFFKQICDESLYIAWDQLDEIMDPNMSYSECKKLEKALQESYDKLLNIGIDDSICEAVVNNEDWEDL